MKIAFIGSKGIPANYGGFETFVDEVSLGLKKRGYEITVICDAEQKENMNDLKEYNGVRLYYSKYIKAKAPVRFYLESMLIALKKSDVIYSCGSGGGYFSFLPGWFGKILITNTDGMGWIRDKYSPLKKKLLKSLIFFTSKWSQYIVYDSKGIEDIFKNVFHRKHNGIVLEYGAHINKFIDIDNNKTNDVLKKYNLFKNGYHLIVSRLEPENNVEMIIEGYAMSEKKFPLIVVGNLTETSYVERIRKNENNNIRFIGGIYNNDELEIVRTNAFTYIHGHSVGGTNPSLLEAMASKNYCICHDNIFNKEVVNDYGMFFKTKENVNEIIHIVENEISKEEYDRYRNGVFNRIREYYNWNKIILRYDEFFQSIERKK